ncbi:MAG: hypothetical protein ACXVC6_06060 [Bacteroidia bacterium]
MAEVFFAFIKGYLAMMATLGAFYFVGHLFLKAVHGFLIFEAFYARIFIKVFVGLLLVVFVYSSVATCLKTVSLGYILVLGSLFCELYLLKKKKISLHLASVESSNFKNEIGGLLLISLFVYSWFARIILNSDSVLGYSLMDRDKVYYSNIAMMIGETGEENRFGINNLLLGSGGMQPYHYLDLWLCDIGTLIGRNVHIVSFYLFVYPLLNILSVMGILALMERFTRINFLKQMFALVLLFAGAFYFNYKSPEFMNAVNIGESPMEFYGEKYAAFYPFVILCFLLFTSEIMPALAVLLFLPVVSVSLMPATVCGLILFSMLLFFRQKISGKELLRLGGYTFILFLFLGTIYSSSQKNNPYLQNDLLYYTDLHGPDWKSIKVFLAELFFRIEQNPLRLILLHLPFLILAFVLCFKKASCHKMKELFWLVFSIVASGLILFGSFYKLFDSIQFYTNVLIILNVFCIYIFLNWCFGDFSIGRKIKIAVAAIVFCLLAFKIYSAVWVLNEHSKENEIYSQEYLANIKKISASERSGLATMFGGVAVEDKFYSFDKSGVNLFYQPFLKQFHPPVDLNVFEINDYSTLPEVASIQKACVESSPFFLFVKGQKQKGQFTNIYQSRLDFINRNAISFIVVSKYAEVDSLLEKRIVFQFKDERSGERFISLKEIR